MNILPEITNFSIVPANIKDALVILSLGYILPYMRIEEEILKAYDSYADSIFRFCLYRVYDRETAADITQETFLHLLEYLIKGNAVEFTKSFLYRTANNIIIDYSRKQKEVSLDNLMEKGFDPADKIEKLGLDEKQLIDTIKKIREDYSTPLLLRYVEDLKPKEIAEVLGKSQNEISVKIYRGLKKLKKILTEGGLEEV